MMPELSPTILQNKTVHTCLNNEYMWDIKYVHLQSGGI